MTYGLLIYLILGNFPYLTYQLKQGAHIKALVLLDYLSLYTCEDSSVIEYQPDPLFPMFCERSEEHTSELQSRGHLVCRLLLENKKKINQNKTGIIDTVGIKATITSDRI